MNGPPLPNDWFHRHFPTFQRIAEFVGRIPHYFRRTSEVADRTPGSADLGSRRSKWRIAGWWYGNRYRSSQYALLRLLAFAQRTQGDVERLIENLAQESSGFYRRRLRRFLNLVRENPSIVDALEQTPEVLNDDEVLALRLAAQSGTMPQTYERLIRLRDEEKRFPTTDTQSIRWYITILGFMLLLITLFLQAAILPVFLKIDDNFRGDASSATGWFHGIASFLTSNGFLVFPLAVVFAWVLWSIPIQQRLRRLWLQHTSGWRFSYTKRHMSELLEIFATTTQAGRPLSGTLSTLARYHHNSTVRNRLLLARNEIEQGSDAWASIADADLLPAEMCKAFRDTTDVTLRAWMMRQSSSMIRSQARLRYELWAHLGRTFTVLFFGMITVGLASSMFGFLANITTNAGAAP